MAAIGDKLDLHNTKGQKNYIEFIGNNEWALRGTTDYLRIIYEDKNKSKIIAIDPLGGPYMAINEFLIYEDYLSSNKILKSIVERNKEYILTFGIV